MAVTTTSAGTRPKFIDQLAKDYRQFEFVPGQQDHWSAKSNTITYNPSRDDQLLYFSVLHELAHALLGHVDYQTDFELLKLESEAWQLAAEVGQKYKINIPDEHIQNCLDTYRDWLHQRSTCPACGTHALQSDANTYVCHNCQTNWRVTTKRFARPYRRTVKRI